LVAAVRSFGGDTHVDMQQFADLLSTPIPVNLSEGSRYVRYELHRLRLRPGAVVNALETARNDVLAQPPAALDLVDLLAPSVDEEALKNAGTRSLYRRSTV
jgi:hypothetical protein